MNEKDRRAYKQILVLTLPIVIQKLFSAAVSSADVIMLNSVGQASISAVSLAVQYTTILHMIHTGVGSGLAMLCSQYWGRGNLKAIEKVEGIALRFGLLSGFIFMLASLCVPEWMMKIYTDDPELISIGANYLKVVSVSYLCLGISEVYLSVLRSIERVKISTVLNVSALLLNIALNAVFIYGWFGLPEMGAAGVALATSVSRVVQLIACYAVSAVSKDVKLRLASMFWKSGLLLKDFLKLSVPALLNDMIWGIAFSSYSIIMGHMGSDMVAANSIASVVRSLGTTACYAVGNASAIYLGKEIGANQLEAAKEDGKRTLKMAIATGLLGGGAVLLMTPFVLQFAKLSDTAMGYLKIMLLINSYYIMGISINSILTAGVFRSGGDSKWGLICDSVNMWCYAVPFAFLAAFVFKWPPMVVYFIICTDEFTKLPFALKHFFSWKWLRNITRENI